MDPDQRVEHGGHRLLVGGLLVLREGEPTPELRLLRDVRRPEGVLEEVPDLRELADGEGPPHELAVAPRVRQRRGLEDGREGETMGGEELGVHRFVGLLVEGLVEVLRGGILRDLDPVSLVEGLGGAQCSLEVTEGLEVLVVLRWRGEVRLERKTSEEIFRKTQGRNEY